MKRFSPERKASVLAKMLPHYNMSAFAVAQMEGISEAIPVSVKVVVTPGLI